MNKYQSKMGLVKIVKGTPNYARRSLENFFESKGLFIASVPEGVVVSDTEKAAEEVEKARRLHKYEKR